MQPNFGSIIWNLLFEPLTAETQQLIVDDVTRIAGYDPRVSIENVIVTQVDQAIQVEMTLRYLQDNQQSVLNLAFSQNSKTLTRN
jgi:phage baseplate assembly protein W